MKSLLPLLALLVVLSSASLAANATTPPAFDAVVAADGTGQYQTVLEAINAAPQTTSARSPWRIRIKAGVYHEIVYAQREKRFIHLVGDDPATTKITEDLGARTIGPDGQPIGTFRTATLHIDADDFTVENLTIENAAGKVGPALALRVDGDRVTFRHCRFLGWQDTVLVNRGRQYFEQCFIAGATDFIFGGATAYFDNCELHCVGSGFITAASTPTEQSYGLVFNHCRITATSPDVKTYLGRPWRAYAAVTFANTTMSSAVRPAGWENWGQPAREKTARYAECGNIGPGADAAKRISWAQVLSSGTAAALTPANVLGGSDQWEPDVSP